MTRCHILFIWCCC